MSAVSEIGPPRDNHVGSCFVRLGKDEVVSSALPRYCESIDEVKRWRDKRNVLSRRISSSRYGEVVEGPPL